MCQTCNGTGAIHSYNGFGYEITPCPKCPPLSDKYFKDRYAAILAKLDESERETA
ncbi:hypothetical protein [Sediminibacillus massiliensis]|uniref:hypothetical protein n=1 Tax=Sediminibacillus massiliensis TaxID=1926277 RepID=UPI0015C40DBB|nr:hypothetical protein [Sediminibacillus massiliensis]